MSNTFRRQNFKHLSTVGTYNIWQIKNAPNKSAFFFESGIHVDADGAPKAYGPRGLAGTLDYLGNAGKPGNWWGVVTDKHENPIQQNGKAPQQPYKDFYISATSLVNRAFKETDVRRFTDATMVPYVALPPKYFRTTGLEIGDLALIINTNTGKFTFAVFADSKNKPNLGEISICAAVALGSPGDPKHGGGPSKGVITIVFPGSGAGQGSIPDDAGIQASGKKILQIFNITNDPTDTLASAYPEFPNFEKALKSIGFGSITQALRVAILPKFW